MGVHSQLLLDTFKSHLELNVLPQSQNLELLPHKPILYITEHRLNIWYVFWHILQFYEKSKLFLNLMTETWRWGNIWTEEEWKSTGTRVWMTRTQNGKNARSRGTEGAKVEHLKYQGSTIQTTDNAQERWMVKALVLIERVAQLASFTQANAFSMQVFIYLFNIHIHTLMRPRAALCS